MYVCHACNKEIELVDKVTRKDTCPHCAADLHCCKACRFYDEYAHNKCRDAVTHYVADRDHANFCSAFVFLEGPRAGAFDKDAQVAKLNALFKKR